MKLERTFKPHRPRYHTGYLVVYLVEAILALLLLVLVTSCAYPVAIRVDGKYGSYQFTPNESSK